MKVSLNWLKQFTDIDIPVDELVAKIGAQLGAVDDVTDLGRKYQGIIVSKVVSCEKHPNADTLQVCWIDDGGKAKDVPRNENGHVQVVCGAPNVRAGLTVAWLPPGSTVPSTYDKEPFVLGSRELRGIVSNGMLASAAELAIGDDHSGIVEIDIEADPGSDFAELYELQDHIIDIENKMFTHRPDCFGILGVAREVAGIQHKQFKSPDWYKSPLDRIKPGATKLDLQVKNELEGLVPRFMAVAMADVHVRRSPLIIQTYLSRVGLRPINNVVDVTNYLMILTGQPTHAYDYDKLPGKSLETRLSRPGDKLRLLTGKEVEFGDDSTVLITSNDMPVGIGGVMGGADTEVTEETKNIVIECANFDMYSIRRTSMKYGLFTDAVTRFNKGQSALQNDIILEEAVATMQYIAGAHVASEVYDAMPKQISAKPAVSAETEFINTRLGAQLPAEDMVKLLENVEFNVEAHGERLIAHAPFWRTDIDIAEDLIEEIGRLYGYDNLPVVLPKRYIKAPNLSAVLQTKTALRDILRTAGANELLTYSFVHGNLLDKAGQDKNLAFKLSNAISPDLQYYRLSLLPGLLDKVHANGKAGYKRFGIFEIGKVHIKSNVDRNGLPNEIDRLGFVYTDIEGKAPAYYSAIPFLQELCGAFGITYEITPGASHEPASDEAKQAWAPFDRDRSGYIRTTDGKPLGIIGEFKTGVRRVLKLPLHTVGFELSLEEFYNRQKPAQYTRLSKYPEVYQDISLKVDASSQFAEIERFLKDNLNVPADSVYSLTPIDIYQKGDTKHLTFRLTIASYVKTLTAAEVNTLLDELADLAAKELGAVRL